MPENRSLKDKRSIIAPAVAHIQHRFKLSAAEVDYQDQWHLGAIGFACVSNDPAQADAVLGTVVRFFERGDLNAELVDVQTELIHAL